MKNKEAANKEADNLIPTRRSLFGLLAGACAVPYFEGPIPNLDLSPVLMKTQEVYAPGVLFTDLLRPGVAAWFAENHDPDAYDGIFPDA